MTLTVNIDCYGFTLARCGVGFDNDVALKKE